MAGASVTATAAERPGDFLAALDHATFVQRDVPLVAREKGARADAPVAFTARSLELRLKRGGDEKPEGWPRRSLLLLEWPDGGRLALESVSGLTDPKAAEPIGPWGRASSGNGAVEIWRIPDPEQEANATARPRRWNEPTPVAWDDPCRGGWFVLRGGGQTARIESWSRFTRTMRAMVADVRDAALPPEDRERLEAVARIELPLSPRSADLQAVRNIAGFLLADRMGRPERPRWVLAPSTEPPADLAPWRALAGLPTNLQPYVFASPAR